MFGKEPGEYIFRAALPAPCTGALIGPRGSKIKALRDKTGAKVFVENETYEGHQMVRVIGSTESIIQALPSVSDAIEDEMPEDKLAQWAAVMSFKEAGGGRARKGGGKRSRRGGGGEDRGGGKGARRGGEERGSDRKQSRSRSRSRHQDREDEAEPSPWDVPEIFDSSPIETIKSLVDQFPPGALSMAHAVSCDLPNYRVGGLIGRRGDYINHVQRETGTQVVFSDANSEVTHRTMTVTGPLVAVYAAHMMMMKRFHEDEARDEAEASRPPRGRGQAPPSEEAHIGELQSQLADLERQLAEARGEAPPSGGRRKGKGGRR